MKKLIFTFFATFALVALMAQVDREIVLIEVGTGTGCGFCPGAAMALEDLYENDDPVAGIEYHNYNSGDPFNTPEASIRCSYYSIGGYPTARFDGGYGVHEGGSASSSLYSTYLPKVNARMQMPTEFTVDITGENSGNLYNVKVTVNKVADYSGDNLVVHLCLTESHIPYSWQGMSTIEFTDRLMAPDGYGTVVSFPSNTGTVEVELNFTFDNTWVKENCELIAWIQDNSNKYVLNTTSVMLPDLDPGYPTWLADFSCDETEFCESGTAHFKDESIGDVIQYAWTFEGGSPSTSSLKNPNIYYDEPGDYPVQLIIYDGSRYDTVYKEAYISVVTAPIVTFGPVEELCNEDWDPYLLTQGSPEGGVYSGDYITEDMYFHPTEAGVGEHVVTYTYTEGGCVVSVDQTITVVNCVGVEQNNENVSLEVFPNPTTGLINVNVNNINNASLQVFDVVGKVIYNIEEINISGQQTLNIDLSNNPAGIYFVQIKNDTQSVSKKVYLK